MIRKCPNCQTQMYDDAYLINKANYLNDMYIARRDENFTKHEAPLEVAVCPKCGHVEFFCNPDQFK